MLPLCSAVFPLPRSATTSSNVRRSPVGVLAARGPRLATWPLSSPPAHGGARRKSLSASLSRLRIARPMAERLPGTDPGGVARLGRGSTETETVERHTVPAASLTRYAQPSSGPGGPRPMAKRSKDKPASPLKREMERLTPVPPGRKRRPKLGPDRSPQRDPRNSPAKE